MRDIRDRFEALDLLEPPYQWPEIERRASFPEKARTPTWFHGAWVAAATAAAVLVFAGGVVAGRWLLGAGSVLDAAFGAGGPLRPATPADVSVLALVVAGAGGGTVLLTAALTLLWRWRKSNGRSVNMKTRGEVMETMEKTINKPDRTIETVTRNNRWLILAVVVLLAVLVALGAWLLIDNFVTSDVEALVKEHEAAFLDNDFVAWSATVTADYTEFDSNAGSTYSLAQMEARMSNFHSSGFAVENLGRMSVNGDWVSISQRVTFMDALDFDCFSLYEIEEGLIKQHLALCTPAP